MTSNAGARDRRYPIGAELIDGGVSFRVWAPDHREVAVVIDGTAYPLEREGEDGYFSAIIAGLGTGALYHFRLDDSEELEADPASRFQPQGPTGPSMVVDPSTYRWKDGGWRGVPRQGQVLYEMHVGTFTPEGTWASAMKRLPYLKEIGVSVIEMMPVNEFHGRFGWGYDGVLLYAATHLYGTPDDLRAFIDEAHRLEIGVILDVVYNHFGPNERFGRFAEAYFNDRYGNEWGRAINYDGEGAAGTRTYVARNAAYWIDEFHFDGLRLDATQALFDSSEMHIVAEIATECRKAAGDRQVYLLAENEPQQSCLLRPIEQGGHGLDAAWNDDFHHSATVALTGRREAYYHDHHGTAQEFASAAKYGYLYQGQRYDWQDRGRGTPGFDLISSNFVHFLQNHDQVANSAKGLRISALSNPAQLRAMTALLLLGPQTPMLFQGQEFAASTPFYYFADNAGELVRLVSEGRCSFLRQFPSIRDPDICANLAEPASDETFDASKLDWKETETHASWLALHRDLIALRRAQPAIHRAADQRSYDASTLSRDALLLRYFGASDPEDGLLLVNLGPDLELDCVPDPLIAPPQGCRWELAWSSETRRYGGTGQRPIDLRRRFALTGHSAVYFIAKAAEPEEEPSAEAMSAWQQEISLIQGE